MKSQELRESFIKYFKEKGHEVVASMSLVPADDPTMLFTSAGVVQFKPLYTGIVELPYKRAVSIQKCLRLSDLDNVGKTRRHLTFFEMLGNFSFGDYFKEEAIIWAWEYLTRVLAIDKSNFRISVHKEDKEAYAIWSKKIGIKSDIIYKLGDESNFWGPAGNSGPCGPCSEIYYDLGEKFSCGKKTCAPGCDCDRFIEIWNLVFPQYDQTVSGERLPLKNKGVDTGMGLERLSAVLQNKDTNFTIDVFYPLVESISDMSGLKYGKDVGADTKINIVADHCRALTFGIGDGVIPSNEERGYVLRRLLRRAERLGRDLKIKGPFIFRLVPEVVDIFKLAYPELEKRREEISLVIKSEEERFLETLEKGLVQFENISMKRKKISGSDAFKLYDTYGFPIELTVEIAQERGVKVDEKGFYEMLAGTQEASRAKTKFVPKGEWKVISESNGLFVGYEKAEVETAILRYNLYEKNIDLVLRENPFYAESGGQVGETGRITGEGYELEVIDTYYLQTSAVCHCSLIKGAFAPAPSGKVKATVDYEKRKESARAHTATHLLHAELRKALGEHAKQEGSFVEPGRFRFDFTHFKSLSDDEIDIIERAVNEKILADLEVEKFVTTIDKAKKLGAMALFGEKYGEDVRVVRIGDFSIELCGGIHLNRTGEIGMFKIIRQEAVAAGIRRIEAIVGKRLFAEIQKRDRIVREMYAGLKCDSDSSLIKRMNDLLADSNAAAKEKEEIFSRLALVEAEKLVEKTNAEKQKIIIQKYEKLGLDGMKLIADRIREKAKDFIGILYEVPESGRADFIVFVGDGLVKKHPANQLVKEISKIWGGGGGGRPHLAEGGGADPKKLPAVEKYLQGLFS